MLIGISLLASGIAFSLAQSMTLAACASIVDNTQRLECFDRLAAQSAKENTKAPDQGAARSSVPSDQRTTADVKAEEGFSLERHWELEPEYKRGTFAFRPHLDNYILLANYSFAPNGAPFSPLASAVPQAGSLSHTELKFQLGFKMKLLENISPAHADLWLGYTQQSYWQAYNRKISSPFRETDYQPELMLVMPADFHLLGMHGRLFNFGLVHQSNGRAAPLSRGWNRIYAQAGMERGNFTLLARVWKRLEVGTGTDDNPDIIDFMGYGDVFGTYRWRGHEFSMLARQNFRTSRGAVQVGWAFPIATHLKGYVQAFSGYGQSLIDYNYSQKTIGLGFLFTY